MIMTITSLLQVVFNTLILPLWNGLRHVVGAIWRNPVLAIVTAIAVLSAASHAHSNELLLLPSFDVITPITSTPSTLLTAANPSLLVVWSLISSAGETVLTVFTVGFKFHSRGFVMICNVDACPEMVHSCTSFAAVVYGFFLLIAKVAILPI